MRKDIHPTWYADATVTCVSCGTVWQTGATTPELQTEICANCHPFYTGQQRIVDTEGRVDTFLKRLRVRDEIQAKLEADRKALTPLDLPLAELGLSKRHLNILAENDMTVVQDVLDKLANEGDQGLAFPGLGRQALSEIKRSLRQRGYELPEGETEEAAE